MPRRNWKKILSIIFAILIIVSYSNTTFALDTAGNTGINFKIPNPFGHGESLEALLVTIIHDILIPIGAIIAVLMVMYAGFLYVTAAGDTAKIGKARDALLWAVIGAAILLGAEVISTVIKGTVTQLQ